MQKSVVQKYPVFIVLLMFLLCSSPGALDFVFHYPDEKYYTDAVLQMMEKGDYFTPYKADGSPRFLKPILTYWVLAGSYRILGVSTFSSRVFFWLAGALLVFITFLMANSLTRNRQTALTAAFITAANPLVLLSSGRSIPDILLVLFLTISAWGFLEILLSENPSKKHYWMAYLGAALAFETKGFPAVAFAGASMLFMIFNPWRKIKFSRLFEPLSMLVSIAVALSWFIVMYLKHGPAFFESFFADQVGNRVSSRMLQALNNLLLGIGNFIAFFIPWIFMVFSKPVQFKKFLRSSTVETQTLVGFITVWAILVILMSGAVFKFYDRYILPVVPLFSVFLAILFTESKTGLKKAVVTILLVLNILLLAFNTWYGIFVLSDKVLWAGVVLTILILSGWKLGWFRSATPEYQIAAGILLFYFNAFSLMYPLLMPNPGEQLVKNLYKENVSATDKIYVYGNIRAASNIRIQSHNRLNVVSMDTMFVLPQDPRHFLVFDGKEQHKLDLSNYEIVKGSEEWLRVPAEKFPGFMQATVQKIKDSGTKYYIAKPRKTGT